MFAVVGKKKKRITYVFYFLKNSYGIIMKTDYVTTSVNPTTLTISFMLFQNSKTWKVLVFFNWPTFEFFKLTSNGLGDSNTNIQQLIHKILVRDQLEHTERSILPHVPNLYYLHATPSAK